MQDWVLLGGSIGTQLASLGTAVWFINKRVDRIETRVEKQLSNGIRSELTDIKVKVAAMGATLKMMPRRKED